MQANHPLITRRTLGLMAGGLFFLNGSPLAQSSNARAGAAAVALRVGQIGRGLQAQIEFGAGALPVGVQFQYATFDAPPPLLQALEGGAIDAGFSNDSVVANLVLNGGTTKAVAAVRSNGEYFKILVKPESAIRSVKDLRAKRIGVFRGSSGESFLYTALKREGITLKDIQVVQLPPGQGAAAFEAGQIDAWSIWDPIASTALQSGARELINGKGFWEYTAFVVASQEALADARLSQAVGDFIEALTVSSARIDPFDKQWARRYAEAFNVSATVAQSAAPNLIYQPGPLDDAASKQFVESVQTYKALGVIKKDVDPKTFFDTRFNARIASTLSSQSVKKPA